MADKSITIQVNFSNKFVYKFVVLIVLLITAAGVLAYGTNSPTVMGHSINEMDPPAGCRDGQFMVLVSDTWQCAPASCQDGQFLMWNAGAWECADAEEPVDEPSYTYSWLTYNWGSCSEPCATGTRTRIVSCRRNDGTIVGDSFCTGTKPATSESCNTQACTGTGCDGCPYGSDYSIIEGRGIATYCNLNGKQGRFKDDSGTWKSWSYTEGPSAALCKYYYSSSYRLVDYGWEIKA